MNRKKVTVFISSIALFVMLLAKPVMAMDISDIEIKEPEYTEEYKKWLELSEDERNEFLQPNKYKLNSEESIDELQQSNNPLQVFRMLRSSADSRYSLQDIIYNNVKVKNQMKTNACWAFSTLGSLESNLAMQDYLNSSAEKSYDFSERHMIYSSVRNAFFNNEINEKGFNTNVSAGGHYLMAQAYLTNGSGAINEYELPFEDSETNIDISNIQNKTTVTTLYDTVELGKSASDKDDLIQKMKSHLSTYGGIYASIYGLGITTSDFYNNETGAIYVDDASKMVNHAVLIVGWDDNYSRENFVEEHRPQNNGAWIVRNSWGDKEQVTLDELKKSNYETNKDTYNQNGIYNYQDLPNDYFIQAMLESGYTANSDNTVFTYKIGDNGYMYVSYEDVNIYSQLWAVKKATNEKDYGKIYQNDILGFSQAFQYQAVCDKVYIANVFNRTSSETEKIDKISVYTLQKWKNCKVYINPNGSDKSIESVQEVKLKYANSNSNDIDLDIGYHMIEFDEPVELNGDSFAVIVEFRTDEIPIIPTESPGEGIYKYAEYNENESFSTVNEGFEQNIWTDTVSFSAENLRGNVLIKAFTQKAEDNSDVVLSNIAVTKQPNKTNYKVGENFETEGMEVTATYSNGSKKVVQNYNVEDGNSLTLGKGFILISYTENEITVKSTLPIVVTVDGNTDANNKTPKSSDFSSANAVYTKINIDTANNINQISVKVSNIKLGDEDDKYTYSYCILPTALTTYARDEYWVNVDSNKVYKENDGTYSIDIDIDWNNLKNVNELANATDLYIHIKEIAEINNQSAESINPIKLTVNDNTQTSTNNNLTSSVKDETVATSKLPKTGKISIILIFIIIIGIGSFSYYRYRNIDR